ncbi:hypothetical protein [Yaniella halotolerans]|uniref:hypothetical protein n=1 Tax=Yaniella halotolerans TaxID=225453 RepID=UPI0003B328F7|nr:hypothetical protein [Yaniella halotolerans]
MPKLPVEIEATDHIEARQIEAIYQRGERHQVLEDEVTEAVWSKGWTPVGKPIFIGLSNGAPVLYRFEVPVETSIGG